MLKHNTPISTYNTQLYDYKMYIIDMINQIDNECVLKFIYDLTLKYYLRG